MYTSCLLYGTLTGIHRIIDRRRRPLLSVQILKECSGCACHSGQFFSPSKEKKKFHVKSNLLIYYLGLYTTLNIHECLFFKQSHIHQETMNRVLNCRKQTLSVILECNGKEKNNRVSPCVIVVRGGTCVCTCVGVMCVCVCVL